jgi:tetratricopeptide (TPR) repeat protein
VRSAFPTRAIALACLPAALVLAVYLRTLPYGFNSFDDEHYVGSNPAVSEGLTAESVRWALTTDMDAGWIPATWLSRLLDVSLFGLDAGKHRLVNVLLHAANALLLFLLVRGATGKDPESFLAAALFAVHPLHVESVAWVTERKDVLFAFFWLLSLFAYRRYAARPSASRYALLLLPAVLSLLSKPSAVTLPFALLLLDYWPLCRLRLPGDPGCATPAGLPAAPLRTLLLEKLPLFALAGAVSAVTLVFQARIGAIPSLDDFPFRARVGNAILSYGAYLRKAAWPSDLSIYYPHPGVLLPWGAVAASSLLLLGATALAVRESRRRKWLPVGWFWFLGTLVPVIGLVQAGGKGMGDRCVYVPLMGIYVALSLGLGELASRLRRPGPAFAGICALLVLPLGAAGYVQAGYWKDSAALFARALEVTGDNWVAHAVLGASSQSTGMDREAMAHFRETLRLFPDLPGIRVRIGKIHERMGDPGEAAEMYRDEIRLAERRGTVLAGWGSEDASDAYAGLGGLLLREGKAGEAEGRFLEALRIRPGNADARNGYGILLADLGRVDEAIGQYRAALRADPRHADARYNLGVALSATGNPAEAEAELEASLRIAPDNPEAQNNLGALLARRGDYEGAAARFREALRLRPGYEGARRNLERATADRERAAGAPRRGAR